MKFGPVAVEAASGAVLAHAVTAGSLRLRKGRVLDAEDIAALDRAGVASVIVASLAEGDVAEDEAASRIAAALEVDGVASRPPGTGRVNLHAERAGVLTVDRTAIDALNRVDPGATVATLADFTTVQPGQMVATVKIIPFAIPGQVLVEIETRASMGRVMAVHPFRALRAGLIQTILPGVKASVLDKTARVTADRLARSGGTIVAERRPVHEEAAVADSIASLAAACDILILFGASAVSDPGDVIPAAIRAAGGTVERVGMPVDPGNLLVLGRIGGMPVLGAPGCARSPKVNGFDWVLDRLAAGIAVTAEDISGMGVGGLLMEIPTRPQPREAVSAQPATANGGVAIVLLAAGRSSRMGGPNKLMARFDGAPLVRRVAQQALSAQSAGVIAVAGHQPERLREALAGLPLTVVDNADFATGLSTSLKTGIRAVPADASGALVMLGDMPAVTWADLDRLIAAFKKHRGRSIVRAVHEGKRGNPVILPRALFGDVMMLEGDTGARGIVEGGSADVIDVEIGQAASLDVDTPSAMRAAGGMLDG